MARDEAMTIQKGRTMDAVEVLAQMVVLEQRALNALKGIAPNCRLLTASLSLHDLSRADFDAMVKAGARLYRDSWSGGCAGAHVGQDSAIFTTEPPNGADALEAEIARREAEIAILRVRLAAE